MRKSIFGLALVASLLSVDSEAGSVTGRINVVAPILNGQNQIYISMTVTSTPSPTDAVFDGTPSGTCTSSWGIALMSDANFKDYVYPLIVMAKAIDAEITLRTSGCISGYPAIVGVDFSPRQ